MKIGGFLFGLSISSGD